MTELFSKVWDMGIVGGYFILAVMVCRLLLTKLPKKFRCLLWLLVGIKLIVPFSFGNGLSKLPPEVSFEWMSGISQQAETEDKNLQSDWQKEEKISDYSQIKEKVPMLEQNTKNQEMGENSALIMPDLAKVFSGIWVAGVAGMLCYGGISYGQLKRRISQAVPCGKGIYRCENLETPFVFGVWTPKIYLPVNLPIKYEKYVIAHEKVHIKRRDYLWKIAAFGLLSIYWFHPLVWLANELFAKDLEYACDEKVISRMGETEKREYSLALLFCCTKGRYFNVAPLAFGEQSIRGRIQNIMNYKKSVFWMIPIGIMICIIAATGFVVLSRKDNRIEEAPAAIESEWQQAKKLPDWEETDFGAAIFLDYADENKIIMHYYRGVFVYDFKKDSMIAALDFGEMFGTNQIQGSEYIDVIIRENGEELFTGICKNGEMGAGIIMNALTGQYRDASEVFDNPVPVLTSEEEREKTYGSFYVAQNGELIYLTPQKEAYSLTKVWKKVNAEEPESAGQNSNDTIIEELPQEKLPKEVNKDNTLIGTIVESDSKSILVEVDSAGMAGYDKIVFHLSEDNDELWEEGTRVFIEHTGFFLESYPPIGDLVAIWKYEDYNTR